MRSCHLLVNQPIGGQLTDGFGAGVTADDVRGRTQCGLGVEAHLALLTGKGCFKGIMNKSSNNNNFIY